MRTMPRLERREVRRNTVARDRASLTTGTSPRGPESDRPTIANKTAWNLSMKPVGFGPACTAVELPVYRATHA